MGALDSWFPRNGKPANTITLYMAGMVRTDRGRVLAKKANEVDAKNRFIKFLHEHCRQEYSATKEDVLVDPLTQRNYDYELTPVDPGMPVIALELVRLFGDEDDLKHNSTWYDMTQRLMSELEVRGISGYSIIAPRFNVPKFRRDQFASDTADRLASIIAQNPDETEIRADEFIIHKVPGLRGVVFAYIRGPRQLNPFRSASEALADLLPRKNDQLNLQGRLRILLIINSDPFQEEDAVRQYFATADAEEFPNVDRIFFELAPSNFCLVFDRRVYDCYRKEDLPDEEELAELFVSFVERRLSSDHGKAFAIVKNLSNKSGGLGRLSLGGKYALISCGEKFVEEGEWGHVMWIIEHLGDDADPPFPNPMHDKLAGGGDNLVITSVRGRLCWLMQKVIIHNVIEYYSTLMDIIETYATGSDFYIRSQACVPLTEIARRRRSHLPDGRMFMPAELSSRVKNLAFRILREAEGAPALLDYISGVFNWIRDLSVDEACQVVDRLSKVAGPTGVHNRCALLLYFALFREGDFQDLPQFDSSGFREKLSQELKSGDPRFRSSLMWLAADETGRGTLSYESWRPFLRSFLSGSYDREAFLHLQRVCRAHVKNSPEELCPLILGIVRKVVSQMIAELGAGGLEILQLTGYIEMLTENCEEPCVLDGVEILLEQTSRSPLVALLNVAATLNRYQSARARQLRSKFNLGACG